MGKWPFHPVVEKSPFGAITSMILVTSFFPLLRLLTQKDLRKVCREIFEMADEAISNFFVQPCLRGGSSKTVYLANYWLSTLMGFFFWKRSNLDAWKFINISEFRCADSSRLFAHPSCPSSPFPLEQWQDDDKTLSALEFANALRVGDLTVALSACSSPTFSTYPTCTAG